jgi:DNA polymerase I-like protein with 3'-5' exonuclease and polymerase domains
VQQLAKNIKIEGYSPRIRELFIPHKRNAVIVSMDFASQEILLQAEWSMDPALVEVFVGDTPKDMHSITGVKIYNAQNPESISYETFREAYTSKSHELHSKVKPARALAKAVNFGSQYRIAAKKLSTMLFVVESEAQVMLDAKAEAFPVAEQWALDEMAQVKKAGKVHTMLGAVRHLREALNSDDRIVSGKADRQAISFRIQGSAAEMTKLAEGRIWKAALEQRFDCEIIAPVHDECVASVSIEDIVPFLKEMHACMIENYAGMTLPIKSSIAFGKSFGPADQIEIGDSPTKEAIEKGLAELAG